MVQDRRWYTIIAALTVVGLVALACGPATVATPTPTASSLPLFVTIYYHVEPNPQLFEAIEPGYFEAVSLTLRQMSASLAEIGAHATFCFAWLYNDLTYCRNHDRQSGEIVNSSRDTGIETYEQIVGDGHELAYHTHPPHSVMDGQVVSYARPDDACAGYGETHRWGGLGADQRVAFQPGVYQFDDPADPWYGQFTWERTSETLFWIADSLGVTVRHANGGQRPLLDVMGRYGRGINHEHSLRQLRSLMAIGFDLISPDVLAYFNPEYEPTGTFWSDLSMGYAAYLGPEANSQVYYPDIDGRQIERAVGTSQGLTFMPAQMAGQAGWGKGNPDPRYYDPAPLGGTGSGGLRWREGAFYEEYPSRTYDPWAGTEVELTFPSLAEQFNRAMELHQQSPGSVNAWGFNHHVVNVMWADLSGISDNWEQEILFILDIADGVADGVANEPRPDLVQFVTMQELSAIYDRIALASSPVQQIALLEESGIEVESLRGMQGAWERDVPRLAGSGSVAVPGEWEGAETDRMRRRRDWAARQPIRLSRRPGEVGWA